MQAEKNEFETRNTNLFFRHSVDSSSSIQAPIFANASCDAFTSPSLPCLLGNYVWYAVNVTGPEDIAATIKFAERRNIRLVVRNTGHDYMGRSTGAGGLAIWTHNLKAVEVKEWSDADYTGKALKIGAGVEGHEALVGAATAGLVVRSLASWYCFWTGSRSDSRI
jgi:FAD/FMN-containing dehydrogenase